VTRRKQAPDVAIVRSSAAEYLTFVAATGSSEQAVEMRYEDENIWLSQKMMATLYDVTIPAINQHLKRIFADRELAPDAVIKQLLNNCCRREDLQRQALQPSGHHRRRLQDRERARGAVPQVGHAGREGLHHPGLGDGR
jgi:hypothetical protein